ncbi:dipeptidase [Pseudomonas sp. N040]|uniref:dipeptidase n=1 Tax=Pseudomonas sp. N040 TaxID=2785325 RepID=UPI0018A2606B|nr:dipeptidase [Pseudomonas sp. N040]MBF7729789.1 dipeptidase [Pseudomonas sp. N040]MBW7013431.1 dipeptidase [Pseudomonas sp. N040]
MRKALLALLLLLVIGLAVFFSVPRLVDQDLNRVLQPAPYPASQAASDLHARLFVADLHDDALLWQRDLLKRIDYGHTDLPRLLEGRVGLQVFSTVTKTPRGLNYERNSGDSDSVTLLVMAQRWPRATWTSLLQRALYQSEKLHQAAAASNGQLRVIRSRADLQRYLEDRQQQPLQLAGLLATEGLQPLEGQLENIDRLYDAGFRMTGLTHFFDNEIGGSAHGIDKGGLTAFGREVIPRLQQKHMLIDLAHASKPLIDDVLAISTQPLVVSHTGVAGTCPGPRNLTDQHLQQIAATGGIVGIGYWDGAICDPSVASIVKAIRYSADLIGVEHVALGSDFDGATSTPFDTTGLVQITQGLIDAGFSEADIAAIMGGNVRDLLLRTLPQD